MEPIALILTALAAGATAAAKDTAGTAVKDAYNGLKHLLKKKFEGDPLAQAVVDAKPEDIDKAEELLKTKITEFGVERDTEILRAAKTLIDTLNSESVIQGGSPYVTVGGNFQGILGNVNTEKGDTHITFG
ncbi:hypothetical protein [Microcystis aeruginosa]|uniref:hypothetical protein n=1 Tax=Microcystis aeruginosa TaxID=1126 RepID=UPI0012306D18|nr:hypothetical protein [Microcystis aeruginosa]GCA88565.1 hypothetical protein MiTa_01912 [Microcystis aeruginosa NIES-4264]